jgi:2-iminobutanoate/2-iminopropanoate deaminase
VDRHAIAPDGSPPPAGAYSPGLVVDDWVFLAGQGGADPATGTLPDGIEAQAEQVFRNVEALLGAAGLTLADVVSCLVHLTDLSLFPAYNAVWERVFTAEPRPVRTTVGAPLLAGMLIEVTAIARTRSV